VFETLTFKKKYTHAWKSSGGDEAKIEEFRAKA